MNDEIFINRSWVYDGSNRTILHYICLSSHIFLKWRWLPIGIGWWLRYSEICFILHVPWSSQSSWTVFLEGKFFQNLNIFPKISKNIEIFSKLSKVFRFLADFEDFEESLPSPVRFQKKVTWRRGTKKMFTFHDSQYQNPKCVFFICMYAVCMYVKDFCRLRFKAQFWLDFIETW